jgi:hypothetical protein
MNLKPSMSCAEGCFNIGTEVSNIFYGTNILGELKMG